MKTYLWWALGLAALIAGGFMGYQVITDIQTRQRAEKYRATLDQINNTNGLPAGLLYWIAYQESRYRDDIISGATRSKAGAIGMFQMLPATAAQYGVDPTNWQDEAGGAARFLKDLYKRFGNWKLAIAGYNDGGGNVHKALTAAGGDVAAAIASLPKETRDYVATVGAGIGVA